MSLLSAILRAAPKCGVNNHKCGKCRHCQKEEEEKWNRIWEQKYGPQMARYYSPESGSHREPSSMMRSSLDTDLPIIEEVYFLPTVASALRSAGGQSLPKRPRKKKASSRV